MHNWNELIGYLAGVFATVALLPQVIKSWQTKSTRDVSLLWTTIYTLDLILWVYYGYLIGSWPLIITVTAEALMSGSLLVLKLRHG